MADTPIFMHLGVSIPLHKKDAKGKVTTIANPFGRWKIEINDYTRKDINDLEKPPVFICPLNINANYFTLLEINQLESWFKKSKAFNLINKKRDILNTK